MWRQLVRLLEVLPRLGTGSALLEGLCESVVRLRVVGRKLDGFSELCDRCLTISVLQFLTPDTQGKRRGLSVGRSSGQPCCFLPRCLGALGVTLLLQHLGEALVRFDRIGPQADGLPEFGECFLG